MLVRIDEKNINSIKNPVFREYAADYLEIYQDFISQIKGFGLDFDADSHSATTKDLLTRLRQKGAVFSNNDSSIATRPISSACQVCCKGTGSATFSISLMCHRNCYYCFNPNQADFDQFSRQKRDWLADLQATIERQPNISHLALTGGEPLLHPNDTFAFFEYIKENLSNVHTRLYTSGDLLKVEYLERLRAANLQEIRFSVKQDDPLPMKEKVFDKMALARDYFPTVMVEMPVLPDSFEYMKTLLLELEDLGIFGINLLEFCYPFANTDEFKRRGYKLKNPPYRVLYNYGYSGGLAISESELVCLQLIEFALDQRLNLSVHYCSLENKHMGQIYQQNTSSQVPNDLLYFSPRDSFLKSAKVFGDDIAEVVKCFETNRVYLYRSIPEDNCLEFHPKEIKHLRDIPIEVGISYHILETDDVDTYLRELKVDLVPPNDFFIQEL